MPFPKLILKPGKERSLDRFHPWIFTGAILKKEGKINDGDMVEILDYQQNYKATAFFQSENTICAKIFSFNGGKGDYPFWKERITQAYALRQQMGFTGNSENNVYRLINAEGDGFPGLIVDIYNKVAVVQFHSLGFYKIKENLVKALQEVLGNDLTAVYNKSKSTLNSEEELPEGWLLGKVKMPVPIIENGVNFLVDIIEGQKTGFFIDQHENRKLLGRFSENAKVLNLFGYTGGFSCYAIKNGASLIHTVDVSASAIAMTEENIKLNAKENSVHQGFARDTFEFLDNTDEMYDIIVVDPPAFAKHQRYIDNALKGYRNVNQKALKHLKPGGLLFTFSCSQAVSAMDFRTAIFSAVALEKRDAQIVYQSGHSADHPVSIFHPEGEYLKGLVLRVL